MDPVVVGILGIVVFLALILLGMNIGISLLVVGAIGYAILMGSIDIGINLLKVDPAVQAGSYSLMVIPLFVIMGNFAFVAGLSDGLYNFCNKWLSRLPGNLACATMAACAGFGAICGSSAATAATMGTIAIPEMRKRGYATHLATGSAAMGGTLGVMIPPSTLFVVYGVIAEENVPKLFAAGVLPGIILTILCIITIIILVTANKSLAPPPEKTKWIVRLKTIPGILPVVVLFGIVLGGMFSGLFTVNQASAVGALIAFIITIVMKKMSWQNFKWVITRSVQTTAMTFLIMIGASAFGRFLTVSGFPDALASTIKGLGVSKYIVLLIIFVIYLILGAVMDELPMMLMTVPIFLPIVEALGYNGIWFGVFVVLCMEMGAIAPPVGLTCFIINGLFKDIQITTIYRGVLPFIITIFVMAGLIAFVPEIATFLPNLFYPSAVAA
jgi:tripartite ATP-independent transporter DctM subunit